MMKRVQVLLDEQDMESFRQLARKSGLSLSAWLRQAGCEKREALEGDPGLDSPARLERFFARCDLREEGREPDWAEHLEVIDRSRLSGT